VIQKEPHTARRVALFKPRPIGPPGEAQHIPVEAARRRAAFERMWLTPPDGDAAAADAKVD
jgi:hypothetical protein